MATRRTKLPEQTAYLRETLISAGLESHLADLLDALAHRVVHVEPRRPFREPGAPRNEVMFVRSGILAKFKPDASGGRQIVALRFPGEGILPREGNAHYGVQAVVRSEVMVGPARECTVVDAGHRKPLDVKIHVPVEDMREPDAQPNDLDPVNDGAATRLGR